MIKNFSSARGHVYMEQCSIIHLDPNDAFEDKLGICTHYSLVPVVIPKGIFSFSQLLCCYLLIAFGDRLVPACKKHTTF